MRRTGIALALCGALTMFFGGTAQGQNPPVRRVLVMPFVVQADPPTAVNGAGSAWIGEAVSILVGDQLQAFGTDCLTRDERVAAFDKLELPATGVLTRATTIRTAEILGASHLVIGEIRAGMSLSLHARLIRLESGQQLADLREQGASNQLFAVSDRLSAALIRALDPRCASGGCRPQTAATRPDPEVFENYVKGLLALAPATQQRFLETALRNAPRDARVLLGLWQVYNEQGLHAKALLAARSVPADSPLVRQARFSAALTLIHLGRLDEASRALMDLEAERSSPVLANALGVLQLRRARPAAETGMATGAAGGSVQGTGPATRLEATAFFTRAVQAAPEDTDYLFNLGYAYALARDTPAALQWLREAVRFDATNGEAHLVMSVVLASTGKPVEAQRELELARLLGARHATAVPGDSVPAGLERLRTDLDSRTTFRVAAIGRPAARDQQEVADFHLREGRRLIAAQKDREASDELRRSIYLSPYQDEPHLLLGRIYERAGRLSDAIDEFKVALWCRESVDAHLALGSALLASGDKNAARAEAERALVLQPNSADARRLLEKIGR